MLCRPLKLCVSVDFRTDVGRIAPYILPTTLYAGRSYLYQAHESHSALSSYTLKTSTIAIGAVRNTIRCDEPDTYRKQQRTHGGGNSALIAKLVEIGEGIGWIKHTVAIKDRLAKYLRLWSRRNFLGAFVTKLTG